MPDGYQMIDAIADAGGVTEIGYDGPDVVLRPGGKRVIALGAAQREHFQRAFDAAEREADAWAKGHAEDDEMAAVMAGEDTQ